MEKVKNFYLGNEDYFCFGCSPNNKYGLQMEFYKDGEEIISIWQPSERFGGYKNILHGGIISTLADEIAAWTVSTLLNKMAVTSKLEVRFLKPIYIDKGDIKIKAKINNIAHKTVNILVNIFNNAEVLCAEANVQYYVLGDKK